MTLLRLNQWRTSANKSFTYLIVLFLGLNVVGCSTPDLPEASHPSPKTPTQTQSIVEVSPPVTLQKLHRTLDQYQPQIKIVSPQPDEVIQDNTLNLKLDVQNFPIFQEETLGLGPHLQIILDDQAAQSIYNLDSPLTFEDLKPGTHTIRVFAAYPWGETYKNQDAYDQTVFHLFTRTPSNNPDLNQPLLTLNQPIGTYGTEPILLDFHLANLPVKPINSQEFVEDIIDWQVEMTLNGERFLIDQWQPIYIKGVKAGKNWIQLQYLDGQAQPLNNTYNNTASAFIYDPEVSNSVTQLFKGELSADQLQAIVDPEFVYEVPTPVIETEEIEVLEETEQPDENPVEPAVLEENEPSLEEFMLSPAEETVEEAEEVTETEAEETLPEDTAAAIEESINETIEELETLKELIIEIEDETIDNVEPAIDETVEELEAVEEVIPQEENGDRLEAILEENLTEVIEQTEMLEESIAEEDNLEDIEATIEETETLQEPMTVAENLDSFTEFIEETVEEEQLTEIIETEEDNTDATDTMLEETVNETVTQIDETSQFPIVIDEPLSQEVIVEEKDVTDIPEEVVKIDQTSDVVSEENISLPQVEQPQSDRWFNKILQQLKLPFFNSDSVETTQPPEVTSVKVSENTENPEMTNTEKSKIKTWFNSVLKRIKLPFSQS